MSQSQQQPFQHQLGDEQRRLSNLLIYPPFQIRQFVWSLAYGLALSLVICILVHAYLDGVYSQIGKLNYPGGQLPEALRDEPLRITIQLAMTSGLLTFILSAFGIFISHRTAGPLYHFRKTIQRISSGDTRLRIRLRPSDDLHEIAQDFNLMIDQLTKRPPEDQK